MVKVCDICGDPGFEEMLAVCSRCNEGAEHVYCMQTLFDTVPPKWICERCKLKESADNKKSTSELHGRFSTQPCLDKADYQELPCFKLNTLHEKTRTKQDCAVSSPCKKRPAENAAEHHISKKQAVESAKRDDTPNSHVNLPDVQNVTAASSEVARKESPSHLVSSGRGVLDDLPSVGILKRTTETGSLGPDTVKPGLVSKCNADKANDSSSHDGFSIKKQTEGPGCILSRCFSVNDGNEGLPFLLPSRPKNLSRSSSGMSRVPNTLIDLKTSTTCSLPNNAANVTEKFNGQHCNAAVKRGGLEKMKRNKTDFVQMRPVSSANSLHQISRSVDTIAAQKSDVTFDAGSENPVTTEASEYVGWCSIASVERDKSKGIEQSGEPCPGVALQEMSEAGGRKFKGTSMDNRPPALGQTNNLRNISNIQVHRQNSVKMVHTHGSEQITNRSCYNNKKRLLVQSGADGWKPVAFPVPMIPGSRNDNRSPHLGNVASQRFGPVNLYHCRPPPVHQRIVVISESARGLGVPSSDTGLTNASQLRNYENCPPQSQALPSFEISWCNYVKISSTATKTLSYLKMQVRASNRADPKACTAARMLPPELHLEELQRGVQYDTWLRLFEEFPPTSNTIGVFFLPEDSQSHFSSYKPLLDRMIHHDLALRVNLEFAQLLIFPSHLLPRAEQRLSWKVSESKSVEDMYLWGIFRTNKGRMQDTPRGVMAQMMPPPAGVPKISTSSPHDSGDLIDMDIDMEGGQDVVHATRIVHGHSSEPQTFSKHISLTSPPLPPGSPPPQPSPPPTPSQSQEDDPFACSKVLANPPNIELPVEHENASLKGRYNQKEKPLQQICKSQPAQLHRDTVTKHEPPMEHHKCGESASLEGASNQKEKTVPQDCVFPPAQLHQKIVPVTSKCLGQVSEIPMTRSQCTINSQTAGEILFENKSKGLSQTSDGNLITSSCSIHSESKQSREGIPTSIGRNVLQRQEGRCHTNSKELHLSCDKGVNEVRSTQDHGENIKMTHPTWTKMGVNGRVDLIGSKDKFRITSEGEVKVEVDLHYENNKLFTGEAHKNRGDESLRMPVLNQRLTHLLSPKRSNSDITSCAISGSRSCSRTELVHIDILCRDKRPCSLGSVGGQALSTSSEDLKSPNTWNSTRDCNVQKQFSGNKDTVILQKEATSCSSEMRDENRKQGWLCNPVPMERNEAASQDISTTVYGQFVPCLPLFPCEDSCTNFDTPQYSGGREIDEQEAGKDPSLRLTQSISLVDQLERPLYRPLSDSKKDSEVNSSIESFPGQFGNELSDIGPELTLSIPRYRKEGNTWIRVEDDTLSCCGDNLKLSLSAF